MIIAVHTTLTTNFSSTRKKGPIGLKFCMYTEQKVTTTQRNFNLLFSILSHGLTLPAFFCPSSKIYWTKKNSSSQ